MNHSALSLLLVGLLLSGCATLDNRDRNLLVSYGVTGPVYDRMQRYQALSLREIIELSKKGVPGRFLVKYLRNSLAVYRLSVEDVVLLRKSGVHDEVIQYLLATPELASLRDQEFLYAHDPFWYSYSPNYYRADNSRHDDDHGHHHDHHH